MNTISMATMLRRSSSPAPVPLTIASIVLVAACSTSPSLPPGRACTGSGTMMKLMRIAAGAPSTEATTMCPAASGIAGARIVHRAGDPGHAAGHHHEHFRAREFGEIGPDEQRRLDLAD